MLSLISKRKMKSEANHEAAVNLPNDVVADILFRLPAKTVGKLRYACKSWSVVISDPSFTRSHLQKTSSIKNNHHIVLDYSDGIMNRKLSMMIQRNGTIESPDSEELVDLHPPNPIPWNNYSMFVGSCDGILCFRTFREIPYDVLLWNPIINECTCLPHSKLCLTNYDSRVGLGFDPLTDDYKVFRISRSDSDTKTSYEAEVYSLRNNSWKNITNSLPPRCNLRYNLQDQVIVRGSFNWLSYSYGKITGPKVIISFEMATDLVHEMQIPESESIMSYGDIRLAAFEDMLSVFVKGKNELALWVMKEYGVLLSWSKLFVIPHHYTPLGFTSTCEVISVVKINDKWTPCATISYDPTTHMNRYIGFNMWPSTRWQLMNHIES